MTIEPSEINGTIYKILGAEDICGLYKRAGYDEGGLDVGPDFLGRASARLTFFEWIEAEGGRVEIIRHPADFERNCGQSFTVHIERSGDVVEVRNPSEPLALCLAFLKTYGVEVRAAPRPY